MQEQMKKALAFVLSLDPRKVVLSQGDNHLNDDGKVQLNFTVNATIDPVELLAGSKI